MNISGIQSGTSAVKLKPDSNEDKTLKNIQNKINAVEKQIQKLSENETMDIEIKTEKIKTLKQQLSELKNQLAARKTEINKEQTESTSTSDKNDSPKPEAAKRNYDTLEISFMQGITKLENGMRHAETVGAVRSDLKSQTGILETEIKLDGSRGASAGDKREKLSEMKQRISNLGNDMQERLKNINDKDNNLNTAADNKSILEISSEDKEKFENAKNDETEHSEKDDECTETK